MFLFQRGSCMTVVTRLTPDRAARTLIMSVEERLVATKEKIARVLEVCGKQVLAWERCVVEPKENQGEAHVTTKVGETPTPPIPL